LRLSQDGAIILDVRSAAEFGAGHVPGSLNIGLGGQFASWAGSLIPLSSAIVIVAESEEKVGEAQLRLARVGVENVDGFLAGGIFSWDRNGFEVAAVPQISVSELKDLIKTQADLQVIDVRRLSEYQSGHAPGAITAPLAGLLFTLPETHHWSKVWASHFVTNLLMQPAQLFVLAIGFALENGGRTPVHHLFALASLLIVFKVPGAIGGAEKAAHKLQSTVEGAFKAVGHAMAKA